MLLRRLAPLLLAACVTAFKDTDPPADAETDPALDSDAPVDETDPPPAETDPAETDGPPPGPACRASLRVDVTGQTWVHRPVLAQVEPFEGLAGDLSNLVVRTVGGEVVPRWVVEAADGRGSVWVRPPRLPLGRTVLELDACGEVGEGAVGPDELFPLWEGFDGGLRGYGVGCFDGTEAACTADADDDEGGAVARLTAGSGCATATPGGYISRQVSPGPGTWRLSLRARVGGRPESGCAGAASASVEVWLGEQRVVEQRCDLSACAACDLAWAPLAGTVVLTGAEPLDLRVEVRPSGCASVDAAIDDLRLTPVLTPAPTVTFVAP